MQGQHATLVVIEYGALWPRWLDPSHLGDIAVVAQHYEGPPHSIVDQLEHRLQRLSANHWQIESAILVSNGRTDLESLGARSILARSLLARLKQSDGERLVLAVSTEHGERACKTLMTLASTLESAALQANIALILASTEAADSSVPRASLASDPPSSAARLRTDRDPALMVSGFDPSKVPLLGSGAFGS